MTSKEAILELICEAKPANIDERRVCFLRKTIEKDLELLEQLEILKKYYPPFKEFLEEMFEKGYNEDLTKIKEWLINE